jgi:hypothetical protein
VLRGKKEVEGRVAKTKASKTKSEEFKAFEALAKPLFRINKRDLDEELSREQPKKPKPSKEKPSKP